MNKIKWHISLRHKTSHKNLQNPPRRASMFNCSVKIKFIPYWEGHGSCGTCDRFMIYCYFLEDTSKVS
jgi:hypothetical protein